MSRRNTAKLGLVLVVLLLSPACVTDTPALFIVHNSALDDGCEPITSGDPEVFLPSGVMDVTIASGYVMFPKVENLMAPSSSVSLGGGGGGGNSGDPGSLYEGNRVTLTGATVSVRSDVGISLNNVDVPLSGTLEPNSEAYTSLAVIDSTTRDLFADLLQDRTETPIAVEVEVRFRGESTAGFEVESNLFRYPLTVCRGCLLAYPLEANDPLEPQPNCRADFIGEDGEVSEDADIDSQLGCFPGQDRLLDCRACRIIRTSQGANPTEVERDCEPSADSG